MDKNAYARKWYRENSKKAISIKKKYREKVRGEVLAIYGGKCVCCGEIEPKFLSFDHINGGGKEHRGKRGSRVQWYKFVRDVHPEGIQILCHNCNLAKGFYGICPHKEEKYGG